MSLTGRRLLLVDDSELVVTMLVDHLETEGFELLVANDGEAGWARILADRPDLVITDVQMPKLSGIDLTKRIRATEETKALPIIMITTLNTMDDRMAGISAGADDFINKPFNKQMLMLKIRNLLKASALHRQLAESFAEMKAVNAELEKLQSRQKYWLEVTGEELRDLAANLKLTVEKLASEVTAPESSARLARSSVEYCKSLAAKLAQVFGEARK